MNRLEIISVRTASDSVNQAGVYMRTFCREFMKSSLAGAHLYINPAASGDLAIILAWYSASATERKSDIGLMLADDLKRFGLVEHVSWIMVDKEEL